MLLLQRMDVHRWSAHSGPNPTQQRPARIPSGLPELYRVPLNWVVELLSCPRHSSYTSPRSPPERLCLYCSESCENSATSENHQNANFAITAFWEVRMVGSALLMTL